MAEAAIRTSKDSLSPSASQSQYHQQPNAQFSEAKKQASGWKEPQIYPGRSADVAETE